MARGLAEDLEWLLDCAARLGAARTASEISRQLVQHVRTATGADGAAFLIREGDELVHVDEDAIGPLFDGRRLGIDESAAGRVIRDGKTIVIKDIEDAAELPLAHYRSTFVSSLVMAPVKSPEPVAVIAAYWARVDGPGERSVALLEALARLAATALESVRRFTIEHEARQQAEAESRAKDEFLSTLGHELRNPLAPIVTVLSLIELRGSDPFEREHQIMDRQIQKVVRLVDDLLDVSRIARGAIQLRRTPVELAWIVTRALEAAGPAIAERGHEIHVEVPAAGLAIDADVDRFTQVIANLLTNAAKYTPRGGRIDVLGDAEGHCARLVVRDTGIGVDGARLPHLLELFTKHQRYRETEGGLGLGLSLVRSIVELHGGVVSAASEGPGRGAAFTVRVPLVLASDHDHLIRGTRPLRVLVVDDNIDAAETLGDLLAVMGHDPVVVHDAPSALEKLASFQPEVAFLDLGLPIVDGFALAERMRERPELAAAPIIAVTAYGRDTDRQRTRAAGFTDHLVKPLSADKLRAVLDKL